MPSRVLTTIGSASSSPRRCMRRRNSSTEAGGNLGALPKPPLTGSNAERRFRAASYRRLSVSGSAEERPRRGRRRRASSPGERRRRGCRGRPSRPGFSSSCGKLASPWRGSGGAAGPAVERLALRREEDGHRPAAVACQRHDGVHVERVDVGPFLAVDLDVDEMFVHQPRDRVVLEGLVLHHMAPAAGRRRPRGAPACPPPVPVRRPRRPTGTSRPGCRRAGGGRGWLGLRVGSRSCRQARPADQESAKSPPGAGPGHPRGRARISRASK